NTEVTVSGRVLGYDGQGLPNVLCTLGLTDSSGHYSIKFNSGSVFRPNFNWGDGRPCSQEGPLGYPQVIHFLGPSFTITQDTVKDFSLLTRPVALSGYVRDINGAPIADAVVPIRHNAT